MELAELRRLLRQIAVDVAERRPDLIHDADAILDQAEPHAGLQQDEAGADFLHERPRLFGQDQFIRHEQVAELHAKGARAVHGEERLARLQGDRRIGAIGKEHDDVRPAFCGAARPALAVPPPSSSRSKMVPK